MNPVTNINFANFVQDSQGTVRLQECITKSVQQLYTEICFM
jgi:hypothetical protein